MASRNFEEFRYSLEKKVVDLYVRVSFGSSGAPTLMTPTAKGVDSVTRTSAGTFTILLSDPYNRLLGVQMTNICASGTPAAPRMYVVSESVATAGNAAINIVFDNASGTATDPASGEEVRLHITLKNSSVP